MQKRVISFVIMFALLVSLCVVGVWAYNVESLDNVSSIFSADVSDNYGELYSSQINSVMKTDNTNYYDNCKFVDGYSLYVDTNSSVSEIDYNWESDADRRVVAYYSTANANAVVSVGKIYNGATPYTGTFRDYVLVCRKSSSVPDVPDYYIY